MVHKIGKGLAVLVAMTGTLSVIPNKFSSEKTFADERARAQKYPYANDLGPDQIDVSAYPVALQRTYQGVLAQKCARCHGMARVINSEFVAPDVWKKYVKRMMIKPGSDISAADAQQIWEFLVYDSKARKTGERKAAWAAHRKKLLQDFRRQHPFRYKELYETR